MLLLIHRYPVIERDPGRIVDGNDVGGCPTTLTRILRAVAVKTTGDLRTDDPESDEDNPVRGKKTVNSPALLFVQIPFYHLQ